MELFDNEMLEPELKPDFTEMCKLLETPEFYKRINIKVFDNYLNEIFDRQVFFHFYLKIF